MIDGGADSSLPRAALQAPGRDRAPKMRSGAFNLPMGNGAAAEHVVRAAVDRLDHRIGSGGLQLAAQDGRVVFSRVLIR